MAIRKCLVIVVLLGLLLSACQPRHYVPEHGIWYCEELQAQVIGHDDWGEDWYPVDNDESGIYTIVNGDKIACTWDANVDSTQILIVCTETDNDKFELGDVIYTLYFVSLGDEKYVLKDEAGKEYTFVRQE